MNALRPATRIAAALIAAIAASPAAAQFYVIQDRATQQCRVATEKPAGNTGEEAAAGPAYATRVEAEAALKRIPDCGGSATGATPAEK